MAQTQYPEFLYHVKRTVTDFHEDKSGATRTTDILATFTDLPAAKKAAYGALESEGYLRDDFESYESKAETEQWSHGDGVLVFAKAPAGQEFEVYLDTKPNDLKFEGNEAGQVEGNLHYVMQTTIDYNSDRIGGIQNTEVEGTYPNRIAAFEAVKTALLDEEVTKEFFSEYDERDDFIGEWPYGDECWVHAVGPTGQNFLVFVKNRPHSHRHHECDHHSGSKCDCACKHTEKECKHKQCKHEDCKCDTV